MQFLYWVELQPVHRIMLLRGFAAVGLIASAFLTADIYHPERSYCPLTEACVAAGKSALGSFLGIPTAIIGIFAFAGLFLLTVLPIQRAHQLLWYAGIAGAVGGGLLFLFQTFALDSYCPLCLLADVAGLATGAVTLTWPGLRGPSQGRLFRGEKLPSVAAWSAGALLVVLLPLAWPRAEPSAWIEITPLTELAFADEDEGGEDPRVGAEGMQGAVDEGMEPPADPDTDPDPDEDPPVIPDTAPAVPAPADPETPADPVAPPTSGDPDPAPETPPKEQPHEHPVEPPAKQPAEQPAEQPREQPTKQPGKAPAEQPGKNPTPPTPADPATVRDPGPETTAANADVPDSKAPDTDPATTTDGDRPAANGEPPPEFPPVPGALESSKSKKSQAPDKSKKESRKSEKEKPRRPKVKRAPLVLYLNPFCGHCRATHKRLHKALEDTGIRVKERRVYTWGGNKYPLWARVIAFAATVDREDRMFEELLRARRDNSSEIFAAAKRAGLMIPVLRQWLRRGRVSKRLVRDFRLVQKAGVRVLPTIDIGRRRLQGEQSYRELRIALRAAAEAAAK